MLSHTEQEVKQPTEVGRKLASSLGQGGYFIGFMYRLIQTSCFSTVVYTRLLEGYKN